MASIAFIDPTVPDYQSLVDGLNPDVQLVVLDPNQDGILQITDALKSGVFDTVHIVSHGTAGNLKVGTTQLNAATLPDYTSLLQQWSNNLTSGADILIYGCNVAQGEVGQDFIQQLHQVTGADIAASDNATGSVVLGGDWNLEYSTGNVTAPLAFQVGVLEAYNSVLAAFTAGDIVVYRVGTGTGSLINTGNAVFLDEYSATGTLVQSIALPVSSSGTNNPLIASGTATSEGLLTLSTSTNGQYLFLTGYGTTTGGATSLSGTSAPRTVGRVDANGVVDTSTALTDFATGNNPRSVVSSNGTDIWVAGAAGGVRYTTLGATTSTQLSTTVVNIRQVNIFNGQLYESDSSGNAIRLGTVGAGLPTTSGQTITNLPGLPTSTGSPYGFFFADLTPSVAGLDTLYVADDGIGIIKYSLVGSTWTANGTVGAAADTYRGLTGSINGTNVTLFATGLGGSSATGGGKLVSLIDNSGYNGAFAGTPTLLATAATNTAFRGVAFAPTNSVVVNPTVNLSVSSNAGTEAGQTVITVTATASSAVVGNQAVSLGVSGTGITAGDYNLSNTTITIPNGSTTGSVTFTVVDDAIVEGTETATLTISSPTSGITLVGATTSQNIVIADNDVAVTKISTIQGSGSTAALTGIQTIEGIVTRAFLGATKLNGFYVQEEDADSDGNGATSEAIFVYDPSGLFTGNVGDKVRITGTVKEFTSTANGNNSSLTEMDITSGTVTDLGANALPTVINVPLPVTSVSDLESYEGMLINLGAGSGNLTVTENFQLGRFGQVVLAVDGASNQVGTDARLDQYTQFNAPSVSGYAAYRAEIAKRKIYLDDGSSTQNVDPTLFGRGGNPLSASNTLRSGDTVANVTGILDERFEGYRIQTSTGVNFTPTNDRPVTPPAVGGTLKVGSFNVLNYFNDLDTNTIITAANGLQFEPRGANTATEFTRQRDKTINAIIATGADVLGLTEIENNGYGSASAIQDLVNGLNAVAGAGTYAFINPGSNSLGTDAISVAFIYKPSKVTPVGAAAFIPNGYGTGSFDVVGRKPLAQTFQQISTGEQFTAVINHFKSKGSSAGGVGDADAGDGQGLSNGTRTRQAQDLAAWLATKPTGTNDADYLLLGDFNAYAQEDPITTLANSGYNNLSQNTSYSYVFDGQVGSLDYALSNSTLASQVTGIEKWHINADEPTVLDYNTEFKSAGQVSSLYSPEPFRTSDHDPVLVGLNLQAPPTFDFSAANYSVTEGDTPGFTTNATVRVTRTGSTTGTDTVQLKLTDSTAKGATFTTFTDPSSVPSQGPSTGSTRYLLPIASGVSLTSILTTDNTGANTDDTVPKVGGGNYGMDGIPDGLGAFDNGDGTFTLLMNHELGNTLGAVRDHGAIGAYVSKFVINKNTLAVVSGEDLIKQVYGWNATTQSLNTTTSTIAFNRFCSADLPSVSAYYNASTGLGTQARIFMNGEEGGSTGFQLATVVTGADAGKTYILGKFNLTTNGSGLTGVGGWENALANPYAQDKTIVIGNNDGGTGIMSNAVAVYVGTKQSTGTEVDKAGLTNGTLKFINVTGNTAEIVNTTTRATNITNGTRFTLSGTASTFFSRPEDGAWNPLNPSEYFFVTTDQLDQVSDGIGSQVGRTRLWRLTFDDITNPDLGGKIDLLVDGDTVNGVKVNMFDNITIDKYGHILLQEDVGNAAHNGKIWQYDIATDSLKLLAKHDPSRFGDIGVAATTPFTVDEESSGIIDAQEILGPGWFLTSDQAHYTTGITASQVEGGQLLALFNPDTYNAADYNNSPITVTFAPGETFKDVQIPIAGDTNIESNETVNLSLANPSSGSSVGTSQPNAVLTIQDNDSFPTVNLSVSSNAGTEAGQTVITVTATASSAVSGNQTINLGVTGTGITSGDYTLSNIAITIPNGSTTGSVTFTVANDALVEGTETATLTISSPTSGITLGTTTTQNIAITDNSFTGVDLSTYVRIGRYDLPEPTRTTPPANSVLAQEVSAVTYNWDTDTLFVIGDGGKSVVQVSKTGQLINSMTLALGGSPQGTDFYDTEGLTYIGGGKFVLVEERDRQVSLFTYNPGTTLAKTDVQTVKLGTTVGNIGIEGISYDPLTAGYIVVKEITPQGIFQTTVNFGAGTASNGSSTTVNSTNLFDPALAGLADFADVYALSNLPSLNGLGDYDNVLVLSQESGKIVNIDRSGTISNSLTIVSDAGNPLPVADQQHEGLTMDNNGFLYVTNENGGGDADHPQLWVYAPSSFIYQNQAPVAISLANTVTSVAENTSTTSPFKVANIIVSDDALGTNTLSLSGTDASAFEITGNGLYLKTGTILDYETKSSYSFTVKVDDSTVGSTPDATTNFTLNITDISEVPPTPGTIFITEVSPWSSGNSVYAADWFEVTNTGTSDVNIAGWTMDDNSNGSAKVALRGLTIIPAGKSAVFIEGLADGSTDAAIIANFKNAWFGATPPTDFLIGTYGGSGVGLSTNGDAVNLFDGAGNRITGVSFGSSTSSTYFTFDNSAARLGSTTLPLPTVSTLSAVGVNAFLSVNNALGVTTKETGSPGTVNAAPTAVVLNNQSNAIAENTSTATRYKVADIAITDDGLGTNSLSVSGTDAGSFEADATGLYIKAGTSLNYEGQSSYAVTVNVDDTTVGNTPDASTNFSLTLTDVKEAATDLSLSANTITENTIIGSGVKIGNITITDPDANGNNNVLSVQGTDAANFEIRNGTELYFKGTSPDFETKPIYNINLTSTDGGLTYSKAFTVNVTDLSEITGGSANDSLIGKNGVNEYMDGGAGNDTFYGLSGDDTLVGGAGTNTANYIYAPGPMGVEIDLATGKGKDGQGGTDTLIQIQNVIGSNFDDLLTGDGNANTLNGRDGNDTINGREGNDVLIGEKGNNVLNGGGDGINIANDGIDTADYKAAPNGVVVNLSTNQASKNGYRDSSKGLDYSDTLLSIENVSGSDKGNDNITGDNFANSLLGNGGNDTLIGLGGNDRLDGGIGADSLVGGTGDDSYSVDNAGDKILENANEGNDIVLSTVNYVLGDFVETLSLKGTALNGTGNALANSIIGNASNNLLNGGAGNDRIDGDVGNDTLTGGSGRDDLSGGLGSDRFDFRTLGDSLLGNNPDIIRDFNATDDKFWVSKVPTVFTQGGTVTTLTQSGISANLTTSNFANLGDAAQFKFGTRTFVAINDNTAGFQSATDAVIELATSGLVGTLTTSNFVV